MQHQLSTSAAALDVATALRELAGRDGRMATLCSENESVRMDWADGVEALLVDDRPLVDLEGLAAEWRGRGIRHVVWSGMGGSSVAVGVLEQLGLLGPAIHILDSTDPAALDALMETLAEGESLEPTAERLRELLEDVVLVAVSLGVTSEEPATHLAWFLDLLATAGLPAARHTLVLTVPGSRLEEAAVALGVQSRPVFLAGLGGLPGRMSAPGSSVFLLPVALGGRQLREVIAAAWAAHDLAGTVEQPARSPYVRLADELAARSRDGRCRLMLELPDRWAPLHVWIEQLFEQTLGKDGKGVVVFSPQRLNANAVGYRDDDLAADVSVPLPGERLDAHAALATAMLGWQLTVALIGYGNGTNIVDEPAVEDYKALARALRDDPAVLETAVERGALEWAAADPRTLAPFVDAILARARAGRLSYLDLTVNGELGTSSRDAAARRLGTVGNELLGVPVKLRRAPAAYHVSEQCQLDGPPGVVSLRVVARSTDEARLGRYSPGFLQAQAVATWQAMRARGRDCTLVVLDRVDDVVDVLAAVERLLRDRLERAS